jgi:hypothetical protein
MFSSHLNYSVEAGGAFLEASGALNAFFLVDDVNHSLPAADCFHRAGPEADTAASAFIGQNIEVYESPAY